MFSYTEARGLHIMPVHYYSPIPDTQALPDDIWHGERQLPSVQLNLPFAIESLDKLMQKFGPECSAFAKQPGHPHQYFTDNAAFGRGDGDVLYAFIRDIKPRKIIEIGSGYSTLLIGQAIRSNQHDDRDYHCDFVAIEPFPPSYLLPPPAEVTRFKKKPLQAVPFNEFDSLKSNDVLFIDSSHSVKTGSDAVYEFLSILPKLASGVLIHIHDIFTPFEYPRGWIKKERFFWNEQYLLEAFLSYNQYFEVIMPLYA